MSEFVIYAQLITEIFSGERNITEAFDGLGEAISNSVEAAGEAADETVRLREVNRAFQVQIGQINRELEQQRQIRDDISRTDNEREAAARRALELGKQLEETFRENGELNIANLERQLEGQEGTVRGTELLNELADLRREKEENIAGAIGQVSEATVSLNSLEQELAENRAIRAAEREKQLIRELGQQQALDRGTIEGTNIERTEFGKRTATREDFAELNELIAKRQTEINEEGERQSEEIRAHEQQRLEEKRNETIAFADLAINLASGVTNLIFQDEKKGAIASAIINTAQSVTRTAAQLGFPLAVPFIAVALATGAAQIAAIRSTNKGSGSSVPSAGDSAIRPPGRTSSGAGFNFPSAGELATAALTRQRSAGQGATDIAAAAAASRPVLVTEDLDRVQRRVEVTEQEATL